MKAFVLTDNRIIFDEFLSIVKKIESVEFDFFCSPPSYGLFEDYVRKGDVRCLNIRENVDFLIRNYGLGFSCHSKQIFPKKLVDAVRCVNIHPGLNPHNRGWFPQVFSILNKKPAGATVHEMDEYVDHGGIIVQEEVAVEASDTSLSLYKKVVAKELALVSEHIERIVFEQYSLTAPSDEGNYNSVKDFHALCEIDLDKRLTMREAIDYLRAMSHPPYKNAFFLDERGRKVWVRIDLFLESGSEEKTINELKGGS